MCDVHVCVIHLYTPAAVTHVEQSFQFSGDTVKIKDRRIFHNCNNFPLFLRDSPHKKHTLHPFQFSDFSLTAKKMTSAVHMSMESFGVIFFHKIV